MWPPWRAVEYIKGGGFPQVWAVLSLVCSSCPCPVLAPKVLKLCTNHFVLVLCRFVWVIEACHFFLVPSQSSSAPFYPSTVLRARERAPTPYSSTVFSLGLTFESLKELEVRQWMCHQWAQCNLEILINSCAQHNPLLCCGPSNFISNYMINARCNEDGIITNYIFWPFPYKCIIHGNMIMIHIQNEL
jgi:hypothetical protein